MKYLFDPELIEGIVIKRKSQFTMVVSIDGAEYHCRCHGKGLGIIRNLNENR